MARRRPHRWATAAAVGVVALIIFVARYSYYAPLQLRLEGTVDTVQRARLQWDSRDGFNEYEGKDLVLGNARALTHGVHRVEVRSAHPSSGEVWITNIEEVTATTRRWLDLTGLEVTGNTELRDWKLGLLQGGASVAFEREIRGVVLHVATGPARGEFDVFVDGHHCGRFGTAEAQAKDVGMRIPIFSVPTLGQYALDVPLPQSPLRALRLESVPAGPLPIDRVSFVSPAGVMQLAARRAGDGSVTVEGFSQPNRSFSWTVFGAQLLLALLLGSAALVVLRWIEDGLSVGGWPRLLRRTFVEHQRWAAWAMFGLATLVFTLWLLACWPGMMTNDSLAAFRQVKTLEFENWNPFSHTLLLLVLLQFYDSPATVVVAHILATAALGSSTFYFLARHGLRWRWILPFFALFALSVPVGAYNLMIWRDIPFSLLTVFWACVLFRLAVQKVTTGVPAPWSIQRAVVAGLLLAAASMVRHNGVIYLFVVPVMLFVFGLLTRRRTLALACTALVAYVAVQYGIGHAIGAHRNTNYPVVRLTLSLNSWGALLTERSGYYTTNQPRDAERLARLMHPDEIRREYNRVTVVPLVYGDNRRDQVTEADAADLSRLFATRAAENFHIYIAERAFMFLATLGFRNWGVANNLWERQLGEHANESLLFLRSDPKSKPLARLARRIFDEGSAYRGLWRGSFLFWNGFYPLLLFVAIFLLYRWLPLCAIASAFLLIQSAALFFTVISNDFRYVYFLLLAGYFAVPFVALELHLRRRAAPPAKIVPLVSGDPPLQLPRTGAADRVGANSTATARSWSPEVPRA